MLLYGVVGRSDRLCLCQYCKATCSALGGKYRKIMVGLKILRFYNDIDAELYLLPVL